VCHFIWPTTLHCRLVDPIYHTCLSIHSPSSKPDGHERRTLTQSCLGGRWGKGHFLGTWGWVGATYLLPSSSGSDFEKSIPFQAEESSRNDFVSRPLMDPVAPWQGVPTSELVFTGAGLASPLRAVALAGGIASPKRKEPSVQSSLNTIV